MTRHEDGERPKRKVTLSARFSCTAVGASLLAAALLFFLQFPNKSGVVVGLPLMALGLVLAWLALD